MIDENPALRVEFLDRLYDESVNPTLTWTDPRPIGARIGVEFEWVLSLIIDYLVRVGLVERAYDGEVRLTAAGEREVLNARSSAQAEGPAHGQLADDGRRVIVSSDNHVFLSHASADKAVADLLRRTLVLGGVPDNRIFYSSDRTSGIPAGVDVQSYLKRSLQEAGLVIELLSKSFLKRPMCLMELGGAWTLDVPTYPIVVPPLTRNGAARQVGNVQMGILGSEPEIDDIFNELHGRLDQHLAIRCKVTSWNQAIADFKQQLPAGRAPLS
jgi:hypothetical protein